MDYNVEQFIFKYTKTYVTDCTSIVNERLIFVLSLLQ